MMDREELPPILVVDDNRDNTEIVRQYLEIRGYPITVAHSGEEALALFETVKPALVLLDVMMPGRDGWEVCRVMKQHPQLAQTVTSKSRSISRHSRLLSNATSPCSRRRSRPDSFGSACITPYF